ncbi:hypothetical protein M422DRAFT_40315 [Sphaerobolus stellatus SS14]|nr:hypothetical protein M422DRAFT_40315 [Sphaerobolus stellatus SS14]
MSYRTYAPLTAANISHLQLQSLSKDHVHAFISSQNQYLSLWAAEGRGSWVKENGLAVEANRHAGDELDCKEPKANKASFTVIKEMGFSSPMLKARVDRKAESKQPLARATRKTMDEGNQNESEEKRYDKKTKREGRSEVNPVGSLKVKPVVLSRKTRPTEEVEEVTARLTERRENRRARRAIRSPKDDRNTKTKECRSRNPDDNSNQQSKSQPKTRGKKSKISSELTLMEGFSAPNIGKERITLKPGRKMGVFDKGMASVPVPLKEKTKRKRKDIGFSELKFLGKDGILKRQRSRKDSTTSEYESEENSKSAKSSEPTNIKLNASKFFLSQAGHAQEDSKQGSLLEINREHVSPASLLSESMASRGDRGSEVWDIELGKPLPSDDSDINSSRHRRKREEDSNQPANISIPVQDTGIRQNGSNYTQSKISRCQEDVVLATTSPSSISLSPSQSISQIPVKVQGKQIAEVFNPKLGILECAKGNTVSAISFYAPFSPQDREKTSFTFRPRFWKNGSRMHCPEADVMQEDANEWEHLSALPLVLPERQIENKEVIFEPATYDENVLAENEISGVAEIERLIPLSESLGYEAIEYLPNDTIFEVPEFSGFIEGEEVEITSMDNPQYSEFLYPAHEQDSVLRSASNSVQCEFEHQAIYEYMDDSLMDLKEHYMYENTTSYEAESAEDYHGDPAVLGDRISTTYPAGYWENDISVSSETSSIANFQLEHDQPFIFTEGRSLLQGIENTFKYDTGLADNTSSLRKAVTSPVHQDVARLLHDHWLPQKL